MSQLGLIIKNEYLTDVRAKSFWISTFLIPVLIVAFGSVMGYLMAESDSAMQVQESIMPDTDKEMTALQGIGLMMGVFLTLFIMM